MIFTPFIIPLFVGAVILIAMAVYASRFKEVSTARMFSLMMILQTLWAINQGAELLTSSLELKIFLLQLRSATNGFIIPTALALALAYTGRSEWFTRRRWALILIVPVISAILSLTSNYHKLFRYDYHLDVSGAYPVLLRTNGAGFLACNGIRPGHNPDHRGALNRRTARQSLPRAQYADPLIYLRYPVFEHLPTQFKDRHL